MRARFVRESKVAASIDHPNVIPIYYAGEEDGIAYIAMRYVAGDDVRSLVRREGPLEPGAGGADRRADRRRARRRPRRRARAPRHQARQRPARPGGSRLPHGLRADQARALDGGHDQARPLGRDARLRRARADPRRAGRRARRRLRARLPPVLHADGRGAVQARGRRGAPVGPPARPAAQAVSEHGGSRRSFDDVIARALAKDPEERYPSAGDLGSRRQGRRAPTSSPKERERLVAKGAAAPIESPTVSAARPADDHRTSTSKMRLRLGCKSARTRGRSAAEPSLGVALLAAAGAGLAAAVAFGLGDDPEPTAQTTPTPDRDRHAHAARRPSAELRVEDELTIGERPNVVRAYRRQRLRRLLPPGPRCGSCRAKTGKVRSYAPRIGVGVNDGAFGFGSLWLAVGRENQVVRLDQRTGRPRGQPDQRAGSARCGGGVQERRLGRARPGQGRARHAAQARSQHGERRSPASSTRTGSGRWRSARPRCGSRPAGGRRSSA